MEKISYHHGGLREELIQKSMELIAREGVESFSLRKAATLCSVSHTAPYKHFKNKDELIRAIVDYIVQDFAYEIQCVAKANQGEHCMLEVGKRYVTYMLEHRDYFKFMFAGEEKATVTLENGRFIYKEGHPFGAFAEVATRILEGGIPSEAERNFVILQCWCVVHGLAHLIICGIFQYEGDYEQLTERMLQAKMACRE